MGMFYRGFDLLIDVKMGFKMERKYLVRISVREIRMGIFLVGVGLGGSLEGMSLVFGVEVLVIILVFFCWIEWIEF